VVTAEEALQDLDDYMQSLSSNCYKNNAERRKKALSSKCASIAKMLSHSNYKGAIQALRNDIRDKADGFLGGDPSNDWIIEQTAQEHICMKVDDLTAYLETMM
jgi:hypothetical protein